MSSIFTKIVEGKIPCYKIDESEDCLAFLDINPNAYGHTLCILKREVDYIFDLSDHEYLSLMKFSKKIAKALKKSVNCERIAVHVHLIPINSMKDLDFSNNLEMQKNNFEEVCNKIKSNLV